MWWVSSWEGRWQLEGGSAPGAHLWQVRLWWVGALEQFTDLAAMADLERYPVLPQPWHVPVSACYHRVWHQSKGIQRIHGNAPLSASQKKNVYVCNHCNFLYLLTFEKIKKRCTQAQGVTDTVTPWEWTSECCWARCPWLFISLLNYSCYPWGPWSPRNDFAAWLLLWGHWWSYMHYLWSHAVLSDFALMQVITPAWL